MKLVVARYNEDIEWTKKYDNVIIYNKGLPLIGYSNVIELPNVGREGHTYYHHIYTNYDNLDEYTIFLQGNPFDHTPNLDDVIQLIKNFKDSFMSISNQTCITTTMFDNLNPSLPLFEVYQHLFGPSNEIQTYYFGIGAQFIVSKECIQRHPREFYKKIVELLNKEINPIEGYVIERYHSLIFV
jgi:hypothetical protein